jgi:hypothetical protein
MPPEVMPPEPLARALEMGLCRYVHLSMMITIPPATGGQPVIYINLPDEEIAGISVEMPAVNKMRVLIAPPPKDYIWRTFSLAWGEMKPAGISTDLVITHGQISMILHSDPWIHSLVDYSYPHSLTLTRGNPELLILENRTAEAQTVDVTLHLMSFHTREDWERYQAMLAVHDKTNELIQKLIDEVGELKAKVEELAKAPPPRRNDPDRLSPFRR